jgi:hypothetical protein
MPAKAARQHSHKQPPQPETQPAWQSNDWYETLLRMKQDQPQRYQRSISTGTQHCVDLYARQKALATRKAA